MKLVLMGTFVMAGLLCGGGVDSKSAMYVGGTATLTQETKGQCDTSNEKAFMFSYNGGKFEVPYGAINEVEYGQKAGRRVGMAIAISPVALLSKKRKHYMTLNYKDAQDKQQAVVFELGKEIVRVTLTTLEARTGKKITYQDDEARKSGRGN